MGRTVTPHLCPTLLATSQAWIQSAPTPRWRPCCSTEPVGSRATLDPMNASSASTQVMFESSYFGLVIK